MPQQSLPQLQILYDGSRQLHVSLIRTLKRFDRQHRVQVNNMAARKFEPRLFDKTPQEMTPELHARRADGTWLRGPEALREFCTAVGLGPVVAFTRVPGLRQSLNVGYRWAVRHINHPVRIPQCTTTVVRANSQGQSPPHV
ncbi:MAG: DUF393 domain-containing protein [Planctomycetaceae bacterium]|nr:DUF393 domain-containing protein [Planctomycetaceae bacterium]